MAQVHKLQGTTEVKSSADKFYGMFKNNITDLTKAYPEVYKSAEVVKGDGKTVGSVILWKYNLGNGVTSIAKEKVAAANENERTITMEVIEGNLMNDFKSFSLKIHVTTKGGGSIVKWSLEYEKKNENVKDPTPYVDLLANLYKKLDSYLLKGH